MVGSRGGASGEPVVLGQVDARFEADAFAMVGQGGSADIDASNSPDFNTFVTLFTGSARAPRHRALPGLRVAMVDDGINDGAIDLSRRTTSVVTNVVRLRRWRPAA